ncbi:MAG: hypothetical protein LBS59_09670 [Puniceicoccales bacterium]|nr:hypothetical protein [Puniceicoccales bacterium]
MKLILSCILLTATAFAFTACEKKADADKKPADPPKTAPADVTPPPPAKP